MAKSRRDADREEAARGRFSGQAFVNPDDMDPEERERMEALWAAYDAADQGDYGPGIALGIFPEDAQAGA